MLQYLKNEANLTHTENGAVTYQSTQSECLDLFATIGALRRESDEEITNRFLRAYAENADLAMKTLFFARDVRGGIGERRVFRTILKWLAHNEPQSVEKNIPYIAEYGRYDDLLALMGTKCERVVLAYIKKQLETDCKALEAGESVSLLAKWLPSVNTSNEDAIRQAKHIARALGMNDAQYQDPWGVKLTAKNITPSGLTIVCTQQDGEPTGELQTGSYYGLEMLQDGEWVAVELLPMEYELAWTSEAWMIPNNAETEWEVNWSRLYGELPAGSYRISKSVMDFRGTGDYDTKTYYAGFDLVDAADTSNVSYEHGGFGVSVPLLSGWEYKVEEYSADGMSYGVSFRPAGEDGWIDFQYWPTFGVCGTGLSMKEFGNGSMGTYDGGAIWNFISYPASKGNFVATTQGVNSWWSRYGETAMEIITQVICTDTIVD